jgi:hypothetical protein
MATPLFTAHILVQDILDDASNLAQLVVKFDPQDRAISPSDATGELTDPLNPQPHLGRGLDLLGETNLHPARGDI